MKAFSRFLSAFLICLLMAGSAALAGQAGTAAGETPSVQAESPAGLFLALSEKTTQSLTFPLTEVHHLR